MGGHYDGRGLWIRLYRYASQLVRSSLADENFIFSLHSKTMAEAINRGKYAFSPVNTVFVRAIYKKGLGTINKEKTREIQCFACIEI